MGYGPVQIFYFILQSFSFGSVWISKNLSTSSRLPRPSLLARNQRRNLRTDYLCRVIQENEYVGIANPTPFRISLRNLCSLFCMWFLLRKHEVFRLNLWGFWCPSLPSFLFLASSVCACVCTCVYVHAVYVLQESSPSTKLWKLLWATEPSFVTINYQGKNIHLSFPV